MLGALVIALEFFLASYWWELVKRFRGYRKGEESMSVVQFVVYCILSFVVLGLILTIILSVILLHQLSKNKLAEGFLYGIIAFVMGSYIAFQCYRYVKTAKKSDIPTSVEDVDLEED